jgi:hypothetical protein
MPDSLLWHGVEIFFISSLRKVMHPEIQWDFFPTKDNTSIHDHVRQERQGVTGSASCSLSQRNTILAVS